MALATNPLFHKDLLIRRSTPFSFTYTCEKNGGYLMDIMAELDEFVWTYYNFYHSTPTKLAEENYFFRFWQEMSVGIISFITAEDVPQDAILPCLAGLLRVVVQKLQETVGLFADMELQITTTNSGATALMLCVKFEQGTNLRVGAYFGMVNIYCHFASSIVDSDRDCYFSHTEGSFHFKLWDPGGCYHSVNYNLEDKDDLEQWSNDTHYF